MLQNTSIQGLTVSGNTSLSNTVITGTTDINRTGSATTTIGNSGSMTVVAGNASLRNVSAQALTVGPLWAGATVLGNCSMSSTLAVTGNCSFNNVSMIGLSVTGSSGTNLLRVQDVPTLNTVVMTDPPTNYTGVNLASLTKGGAYSQPIAAPVSGEYTFSTTANDYGKLLTNMSVVINQTYKVTITVKATTANTKMNFALTNNTLIQDLGIIGSSYKTYSFYFKAPISISTDFTILGTTYEVRTIQYKYISIEPFYTTNVDTLNVTGSSSISGNINVVSGNNIPLFSSTTTNNTVGFVSTIAFGNNTFVMTGFTGTVLTSTNNGASWTTSQQLGSTSNFFRSCTYGNGIFILNTNEKPGKNWTSIDGVTWTARPNMTDAAFDGMCSNTFGNGIFIGVSRTNSIFQSTDGITWSRIALAGVWQGVVYDNNKFVACGNDKIATSSSNGLIWSEVATPPGEWRYIAYGNGIYMISSWETGGGHIATSTDAVTWSRIKTFGSATNGLIYQNKIWYVSVLGKLHYSIDNGVTWTGTNILQSGIIAYGNEKFISGYENNQIVFNTRTIGTDGLMIKDDIIRIGREGTTTNINSDTTTISGNINLTTASSMGDTTFSILSQSSISTSNTQSVFGNGIFVISSDPGKIIRSTDGITWTPSTTVFTANNFRGLSFNSVTNKFMLISQSSGAVWTSTDGLTWDVVSSVITPIYWSAYGNGITMGIFASNISQVAITNNDASTAWIGKTIPTPGGNMLGLCFGSISDGTNVFVIHGTNYIRRSVNIVNADSLVDATSWTLPVLGEGNYAYNWRSSAFANDIFMLASWDNPGRLTISRDGGRSWSVPIDFGILLNAIIYINDEWYIGSDNKILVSKDNGLTWRQKDVTFPIGGFLYGNSTFVSSGRDSQTRIGITKTPSETAAITIGRIGTTSTLKGNVKLGEDTGSVLTVSKPITIGYTYPIGLRSQIGYSVSIDVVWSQTAGANIATSPTLSPGNYLVTIAFELTGGTFSPNFIYTSGAGANMSIPLVASGDRTLVNGSFLLFRNTTEKFHYRVFSANTFTVATSVNAMKIIRLS